ncbi:MAG: DUF1016 family protein [Deltaproteobacteria bacterium]|nr:DUF1016 family protein [Deltaproteobacteria bacterium]
MKSYNRVMLGRKSIYAEECLEGGFIGTDFLSAINLSGKLPEEWRDFNRDNIPNYLKEHPEKSKVTAGLACAALWTIAKGLPKGSIVLSPNGEGQYMVGEIISEYSYHPGKTLPHRRLVKWFPNPVDRKSMSEPLRNSTGAIGTVCDITRYAEEIDRLIGGQSAPIVTTSSPEIESPSEFVLEKHLEDFLVENWNQTDLSKKYDIYEEDGEVVGKQYRVDNGWIDILAISKDKKELLVVELKKGRTNDAVVGQVQRYMGYVLEELAEPDQKVRGVIIAMEDDINIRRALKVARDIEFFRYQVSFKLSKVA